MIRSSFPWDCCRRRALARISLSTMPGVSSMKMGACASCSMARTTFCMSSRQSEPVRILCESTFAWEHSKRSSSASRDISSEKMPTVFWSSMAAFSAMFNANAVFRKLEDSGFGIVENIFRGIALLGGTRNGGIGGVNQTAQQRLVADDLDVVLDTGPVGDTVHQSRNVADVANRLELLAPLQLLDQRDQVDWPRRFGQVHHSRID